MQIKKFELEIAGKKVIAEFGKLANLANGSVTIQLGDTVVLATAVMSKSLREGINYFPLLVDYEERLYAAGKIKGSRFIKRETRPSDEAILSGRLIDRTIRPLFPEGMRNDVQIIITVLSVDGANDPDIPSILGASLALTYSDIPWDGPVAAIRLGYLEGKFIVNPTYEEREKSLLDIVFSGTIDRINMIEAGGKEVDEKIVMEAAKIAQSEIRKIVEFENAIRKEIGKAKTEVVKILANPELKKEVNDFLEGKLEPVIYIEDKEKYVENFAALRKSLLTFIEEKHGKDKVKEADAEMEEAVNAIVHKNILKSEKRPDGRKLNEVRELKVSIGILPRTHGSGLFQRGTTQALVVATLGAPGDEQTIEGIEVNGTKRFMLHYSFPPYSVGEVSPLRGAGRREIGHGALAERSLESLVPQKDVFPYTVRLVSEILSSNGSSSMASVCGGSLALMDAGVPIKTAAAGIAMGLMSDKEGNYKVLTDIQGPEDHFGDMDFKVAGTKDGVTGVQMDVKIDGVNLEIIEKTLMQAKEARLHILAEMGKIISSPKAEMSPYAPRITSFKIDTDKIRDVIGPGGKVINEIIAETGVTIDIDDDGTVMVTSKDAVASKKAVEWIKNIVRVVAVGEVFQGKVTRLMDFGAFVEVLPGQEGLVHISELAPYRVNKVSDVVKVGDQVLVKVIQIDDLGRINLSMKQITKKI